MEIYGFYNGEKKSLTQLAAESGVGYDTLLARYKAGVPFGELVDIAEESGVSEEELAGLRQELTQYVDDAVAAVPQSDEFRPNLLDNWYFGKPVNQRGKTSYSVEGYTIDRWKATGAPSVAVNDGHLTFSATTASAWLTQQLEFPVTGTLTLSALAKSASVAGALSLRTNGSQTVLQQRNIPISSTYQLVTFTFDVEASAIVGDLHAVFSGTAGASVDILAVKLELSDTQTLAHQDADGNWQLNEIPSYGLQLENCRRYYQRIYTHGTYAISLAFGHMSSTTAGRVVLLLPTPMQAVPTMTVSGVKFSVKSVSTSTNLSATPTVLTLRGGNMLHLSFTSPTALNTNAVAVLCYYGADSSTHYIEFSADL